MERERRGFFCLPFRGPTKTPEEMISGTERYILQGLFFPSCIVYTLKFPRSCDSQNATCVFQLRKELSLLRSLIRFFAILCNANALSNHFLFAFLLPPFPFPSPPLPAPSLGTLSEVQSHSPDQQLLMPMDQI